MVMHAIHRAHVEHYRFGCDEHSSTNTAAEPERYQGRSRFATRIDDRDNVRQLCWSNYAMRELVPACRADLRAGRGPDES